MPKRDGECERGCNRDDECDREGERDRWRDRDYCYFLSFTIMMLTVMKKRALKKLELLLRIFPALQTSRVLYISMNAR